MRPRPEDPAGGQGGALAYFVLPVDAIPDVLAGVGFTDDAAVIAAVVSVLGAHIRPRHRELARSALDRLGGREISR